MSTMFSMFPSAKTEKSNADFPLTVEQQLNYAQPAESARTPVVTPNSAGADYDYLRSMKTHVDGLWLCCCGAENELVHWTGTYPFKHLKCEKCEHVLCTNCETTQILTPWNENLGVDSDHNGLRLSQICPSCGLSYRAGLFSNQTWGLAPTTACHCGEHATSKWLKYTMKASGMYKLDPKKATQDLTNARLEKVQSLGRHEFTPSTPYCSDHQTPFENERPIPRKRPMPRPLQIPNTSSNPRDSILQTPTTISRPVEHQQKPVLYVDTEANQSFLKRSGAVHLKQGNPYLARSASYEPSPVSARLSLEDRAGTWVATVNYGGLREEARAYLISIIGEQTFIDIEDSEQGEKMIWAVIYDKLSHSVSPPPTVQDSIDEVAQLALSASHVTLNALLPVQTAVTYDQLLGSVEEVPRQRMSRVLTDLSSQPPRQSMCADFVEYEASDASSTSSTHADSDLVKMRKVSAIVVQATKDGGEDDWAETYRLYQQSLSRGS